MTWYVLYLDVLDVSDGTDGPSRRVCLSVRAHAVGCVVPVADDEINWLSPVANLVNPDIECYSGFSAGC